jgi:hypothetical protein
MLSRKVDEWKPLPGPVEVDGELGGDVVRGCEHI